MRRSWLSLRVRTGEATANMANAPKTQDPTEAALSAIEEALQLGKEAETSEAKPADAVTTPEVVRPQRRPITAAPPEPESPRPEPTRRPARPLLRTAANDDRQSVGQILSRLHSRPSRSPMVIALLLAAAWIVGGIAWAASYYGPELSGGVLSIVTQPALFPLAAGILLPAIGFLLLAVLIRRMQEMRQIARSMTEITVRLAEPEGVSTDTVVTIGQAIRREVAALGDGVERAIARATELESMVKNEVSTLEHAYDDNELRVRNLVEELQSERDAILSHASRLREAIGGAHQAFTLDVEQVAERVNAGVTEATDRVSAVINARSEEARTQLTTAGDLIIDALTIKSAETTERLTQVGIEVGKALTSRSEMVAEAFEQSSNAATTQIAATGERAVEQFVSATETLGKRITDSLDGFDTTVKIHGAGLVERMAQISENAQQSVTDLDRQLAKKAQEIAETLDMRGSRLTEALDARTQSLNEAISQRTQTMTQALADGAKAATEATDKTVAGMGEYFAEKAREIADTIYVRAEAVDQTLGTRAQEMADRMAARMNAIDQTLGNRAEQVSDDIAGRLGSIEKSIVERATSLVETLDHRVNQFDAVVTGKFANIVNSIEGKGAVIGDTLTTRVEHVSETLRQHAVEVERLLGGLAEEVSKGLAERTREVGVTYEVLRKDVAGILEQLGESNSQLRSQLEGLATHLRPLEKTIAERLTTLQTSIESTVASTRGAVEWADGQVRDLREVSTGVLRDLSTLTLRFENQGRAIAGVAETLSETHGRIDQTLASRREAIEEIVDLLVSRTAEVEDKLSGRTAELGQRLAGFTQVLEDSLNASQQRAQELAKLLADTTVQTTQAIANQHELIRGAYSEERGRTNIALKSTYQDAIDDISRLFQEMHGRFTDTARELRGITEEVQQTLEHTRDELQRGLRELPAETVESTQALRALVTDQLKAISELGDIVAQQNRTLQVVEPGRRARHEEPEEPAPARRERDGFNGDGPRPRRPTRPEPEARDGQPIRGGWLNERSARPARESGANLAAERPQQPALESFDSLAIDISRMIVHDAAVDVWERYQRGERDAFGRRLYTAQGQKTFDEIRRKYRRSGEFRNTVDRYIDEFERLLERVARDDHGQVLTKTYLTSDTGKVYTLLAHAAGRLD